MFTSRLLLLALVAAILELTLEARARCGGVLQRLAHEPLAEGLSGLSSLWLRVRRGRLWG